MLSSLHIKNIVLIEQLTLDFARGLTGFTGETGAGKSILLDSLGLALGARADMNLIRKGAEQASVTAAFSIDKNHPVRDVFAAHDIEFSTDIMLRRVLTSDGKSKAFVNDQPVGVTVLRDIGDQLADIHGQFETYGLLNPTSHIGLLDQFGGLSDDVARMATLYKKMQNAKAAWVDAIDAAKRARDDEEFLSHAVDELQKLNPRVGEEAELTSIKQSLSQREFILTSLNEIEGYVSGDKGAETYLIKTARNLQKLLDKQLLPDGDAGMDYVDAALKNVQELSHFIDNARSLFDHPDHNLESIDDRLYALRAAARKYQCAVEELADKQDEFKSILTRLKISDDDIAQKEKLYITALRDAESAARKLTNSRTQAAMQLDKQVNDELPPLKLAKAKFKTQILSRAELTSNGMDDVHFTVATNENSDFGALHRVASGGEMARFMLAIKLVLASKMPHANCYVFDEIDTGIGGSTAAAVGDRLARMAGHHQVLVVTHSPQVAAAAKHHFNVRKDGKQTDVALLSPDERREEIARMLSGSEITDEARAAALKLLSPSHKSAA